MHKSGKKIKILGGLGALALTFFPVQANEESQQYANNLESKTKQVQYDKSAYENSALEHLTQALAPGKAHAGEKTVGETLEEPICK